MSSDIATKEDLISALTHILSSSIWNNSGVSRLKASLKSALDRAETLTIRKTRKSRSTTEYNKFISDKLLKYHVKYPNLDRQKLMKLANIAWNRHKLNI